MDVFNLRNQIVADYASFTRSFARIKVPDIKAQIDEIYASDKYWPEPLLQLSPHFEPSQDGACVAAEDGAARGVRQREAALRRGARRRQTEQLDLSCARRSRLESFKRLGVTLRTHFDAVVRGMLDNRSNAFVEAMNGLLQQAKRAARGYRTATNFIAIAYLRLGKLAHLPASPFAPAMAQSAGITTHRM